jgi:MFS family permease
VIFRFSLYGFLKNQRYFEPFLFLAFLEKGLDFTQIGLLIAVRELTTTVLEIPSGAVADVFGRRLSMMLSFCAYIVSFLLFGFAVDTWLLYAGMLLYGVGEAFRTGTHKAMIFAWLRDRGREQERLRVYGYTRSWSKFGSAASVLLAAPIVLFSDSYEWIFFAAIPPYALNLINFFGYPRDLDEAHEQQRSPGQVMRQIRRTLAGAAGRPRLRRLFLESMGFDGVFAATKDYLQPVLEALAISIAAAWLASDDLSDIQRSALLVGPVYFLLHLLSGVASRWSHRVSDASGGEDRVARRLWAGSVLVFALLTAAGLFGVLIGAVAAFVTLHVLHNLWRPVLISRMDEHGSGIQGASLLSVESQARRVATMIVAPLLGYAVDLATAAGSPGPWWPVGGVGLACSLVFLVTARARYPNTASTGM